MAYVHPKCAHGRLAIQLFYHNSYVCPDECSGAGPMLHYIGRPSHDQMRAWHKAGLCSMCGRPTRNRFWCTSGDRADNCNKAYGEWGYDALKAAKIT